MTILKALISHDPEEGGAYESDAIIHEGRMWLVGKWLQSPEQGWMMPARIVRPLTPGVWQKGAQGHCDFLVTCPIPKSVFEEGAALPEGQFEVVDRPAIRISTGGVH